MPAMMSGREPGSWQVILADLALILFLVTTTALVREGEDGEEMPRTPAAAPAQAIYRPGASMPDFSQWLSSQSLDPQLSASIVATYTRDQRDTVWEEAQALADQAKAAGLSAQVILREAVPESIGEADLFVSLAYDRPSESAD